MASVANRLREEAREEWSAMSVPLDAEDSWAVLLNDCHARERQKVTLLEEFWHIFLGHKRSVFLLSASSVFLLSAGRAFFLHTDGVFIFFLSTGGVLSLRAELLEFLLPILLRLLSIRRALPTVPKPSLR
jgi:hypothetical protein